MVHSRTDWASISRVAKFVLLVASINSPACPTFNWVGVNARVLESILAKSSFL